MKSNYILLSFALAIANLDCSARSESIPEWDELDGMPYEKQFGIIAEMSADHRNKLIAEIKSPLVPDYIREQHSGLLLRLGDQETMEKEKKRLIDSDQRESLQAIEELRTCRDPAAIAALCPFFLRKDRQYLLPAASDGMYEMLPDTPGFSPEIYEWVKIIRRDHFSSGSFIFGEWWKMNNGPFEKGDWMAVKPWPLEDLHGLGVSLNTPARNVGIATNAESDQEPKSRLPLPPTHDSGPDPSGAFSNYTSTSNRFRYIG